MKTVRNWSASPLSRLDRASRSQGLHSYFRAYILSLTPNGEVASQWQFYADKSAGYCLCFDGRKLDKAFIAFSKAIKSRARGSFRVLYDEKRLRSLMKQYVTIRWKRPRT